MFEPHSPEIDPTTAQAMIAIEEANTTWFRAITVGTVSLGVFLTAFVIADPDLKPREPTLVADPSCNPC